MLIREVMTSPAITVGPDVSVKGCLMLLDRHRVTSLPVVDREGRIVGLVSEADLLRGAVRHDTRTHMTAVHEPDQHPRCVGEVMTTPSMTVTGGSDLREAVELMTSTAVKSLPVIDDGRVVGVVSRSDVVHLLARSDERIRAEVDELLRSVGVECEVDVDAGVVRITNLADPTQSKVAGVIAGSVAGVISVRLGP